MEASGSHIRGSAVLPSNRREQRAGCFLHHGSISTPHFVGGFGHPSRRTVGVLPVKTDLRVEFAGLPPLTITPVIHTYPKRFDSGSNRLGYLANDKAQPKLLIRNVCEPGSMVQSYLVRLQRVRSKQRGSSSMGAFSVRTYPGLGWKTLGRRCKIIIGEAQTKVWEWVQIPQFSCVNLYPRFICKTARL